MPTDRPAAHSHPFAVVDVETSGLAADRDRILSIAVVQVGTDGSVGERWTTLLDPGCDPGPVHIHGLTRELLAGSPTFADVVDELASRLAGRVMVAHNASFDWRFLTAEAARAGRELPIERRMCSCVLARRLDLPVPDFRLATIADFWAVPFERQHDALADALVVAEVLPRMLALAGEQDLELPITAGDRTPAPRPTSAPRARCAFVNPGPLADAGLIQGMRIAFTGETDTPRDRLEQLAIDAGLAVATSVSRRTSVLVTNHVGSGSGKAKAALAHGVPVIDEATFLRLAANVAAGSPRDLPAPALVRAPALVPTPAPVAAPTPTGEPAPVTQPVSAAPAAPTATSATSATSAASATSAGPTAGHVPAARGGGGPAARRPFAVRRVLVLGGPHAEAAALRERVITAGGLAAVNLTASVTDVVCLPGGETDRRMARIHTLGLPVTTADTFLRLLDDLLATGRRAPVQLGGGAPKPLARGAVVDLPVATAGARWTVAATWAWDSTAEIDLVAFLVGVNELVGDDDDFVFFNQPHTDDGAASLSVDGPSEQAITLDLMTLPSSVHRVVVAAALGDGRTFGDIGPVNVAARTPDGQPWLHATLDAATTERTMVLAEVYRRNGMWRFRAVGQGHNHGLVDLARGYGVDATD